MHLDKLGKKIKSRIYILSRMRNFISESLAKDLWRRLIEPHFLYVDVVYDGASKQARRQLQVRQNNALRNVCNVGKRFSASTLHQQTSITRLDTIRKERCWVDTYKALNGLAPPSSSCLFKRPNSERCLRPEEIWPSHLHLIDNICWLEFCESMLPILESHSTTYAY